MTAWSTGKICVIFLLLFVCQGSGLAAVGVPPRSTPSFITEKNITNPIFDGNTYIYEAGLQNSQTLILVHGVGEEASLIWQDLVALLADRFHVVAFDLPGFGRSGKSNSLYSPERYGQFINWLIKQHADEPVILLGHSLGGALVLRYASTYPETVRHLIVVDAAAILHRIAISKNFIQIEEPDPQQKGLTRLLSKPFEKPLHALNHLIGTVVEKLEFSKTDEGIDSIVGDKGLRNVILGGNPQAIAGLALVQEDFTEHIDKNKVPTSIIWGRNDDVSPLRTGKLLAGKLPINNFRIIDQAGHVPMREQKDEFNRVLLAEINSPPVGIDKKIPTDRGLKTGHCKQQSDVVFSGHFDRILIEGCNRVLLKDVSARFIGIKKSEVIMEDSSVTAAETALDLVRSKLIGTNIFIAGETAIRSSGSRLDLAGAQIIGRKTAVQTPDKTVILFSVSKVTSPLTDGNLHGVYRLDKKTSL